MADEHRRCPFCGAKGEVENVPEWGCRIRCRNCHASIECFCDSKAIAWKHWDHRASDTQCATCVWYRISDAFNWCELVHQKRDSSEYCSKWRKA